MSVTVGDSIAFLFGSYRSSM